MIKIVMKYNSLKEIVKGAHNDTQDQNRAHPKNSDGVQLTNATWYL